MGPIDCAERAITKASVENDFSPWFAIHSLATAWYKEGRRNRHPLPPSWLLIMQVVSAVPYVGENNSQHPLAPLLNSDAIGRAWVNSHPGQLLDVGEPSIASLLLLLRVRRVIMTSATGVDLLR